MAGLIGAAIREAVRVQVVHLSVCTIACSHGASAITMMGHWQITLLSEAVAIDHVVLLLRVSS